MLAFIYSVFALLRDIVTEIILYLAVDIVVKISLKTAKDERQKGGIWMKESFALMVLCLCVYLTHHTPYMLLLSSFATFVYSQLIGRVNFRYWWFQLATRWDEFQQHEESMEQYNSMQQSRERMNNSQHPPPNVQMNMGGPTHTQHWMPQAAQMPMPAFQPDNSSPRIERPPFPQFEAWYPADQNKKPSTSASGPVMSSQRGGHVAFGGMQPREMSPHGFSHPPPTFLPQYPPLNELVRRPLNARTSPVTQVAPPVQKNLNWSEMARIKVRSALGLPEPVATPPGLHNSGNNLCFLNAVLQCVANSPGVTESLVYMTQTNSLKCQSKETAFIEATTRLFERLQTHPSQVMNSAEDTVELREAVHQLSGAMVTSPGEPHVRQEQQDAAEYLMWMLSALHNATNQFSPHQQNNNRLNHAQQNQHQGVHRLANMNLNMLKFIYADLSPQRIEELKINCRKEIEQANGVDNDTYAEPIQRLSDLEWLSYKNKNRSVFDDLFTGQLVEAQHCLSCNRVSVGIQAFNILPVPIVEPRQLNGLVYLEDCFTKFGNIENLYGADGLNCENCCQVDLRADLGASPILTNGGRINNGGTGLRQRPAPRRLVSHPTDSPIVPHNAMSPIPGATTAFTGAGEMFNDSGYNETNIRTSTPLGAPVITPKLTDGQKRSLLRQLPECLVVQLMRFTVKRGNLPTKISAPVTIPLTQLDLTQQVIDNVMHSRRSDGAHPVASYRYSLYGLCLHLGAESTSCGHYIAYVKAVSDNTWYRFDDANVTPVNMEYELNTRQVRENAYLLFYKKVM